jgi:hypothetical protein
MPNAVMLNVNVVSVAALKFNQLWPTIEAEKYLKLKSSIFKSILINFVLLKQLMFVFWKCKNVTFFKKKVAIFYASLNLFSSQNVTKIFVFYVSNCKKNPGSCTLKHFTAVINTNYCAIFL